LTKFQVYSIIALSIAATINKMGKESFGQKIKELRRERKVSQRKLAQYCGIDCGYLSRIESSSFPPPSEKVIRKMADFLEVPPDELLYLANKFPSDIKEIITHDPSISGMLRRTANLTPEQRRKLDEYIEQMERDG